MRAFGSECIELDLQSGSRNRSVIGAVKGAKQKRLALDCAHIEPAALSGTIRSCCAALSLRFDVFISSIVSVCGVREWGRDASHTQIPTHRSCRVDRAIPVDVFMPAPFSSVTLRLYGKMDVSGAKRRAHPANARERESLITRPTFLSNAGLRSRPSRRPHQEPAASGRHLRLRDSTHSSAEAMSWHDGRWERMSAPAHVKRSGFMTEQCGGKGSRQSGKDFFKDEGRPEISKQKPLPIGTKSGTV